MKNEFIDGAESFRKMLLESVNPFVWPHIEGVFATFARQNGFVPKNINKISDSFDNEGK
jgi:hypothetical protein